MAHVIKISVTTLHKLFKGELEIYLKSQFPSFNLRKLPNARVVRLKGIKDISEQPNVIEYILDECRKQDGALMQLRKYLPSYKRNGQLLIKKMNRLGLNEWYLEKIVRKGKK